MNEYSADDERKAKEDVLEKYGARAKEESREAGGVFAKDSTRHQRLWLKANPAGMAEKKLIGNLGVQCDVFSTKLCSVCPDE